MEAPPQVLRLTLPSFELVRLCCRSGLYDGDSSKWTKAAGPVETTDGAANVFSVPPATAASSLVEAKSGRKQAKKAKKLSQSANIYKTGGAKRRRTLRSQLIRRRCGSRPRRRKTRCGEENALMLTYTYVRACVYVSSSRQQEAETNSYQETASQPHRKAAQPFVSKFRFSYAAVVSAAAAVPGADGRVRRPTRRRHSRGSFILHPVSAAKSEFFLVMLRPLLCDSETFDE